MVRYEVEPEDGSELPPGSRFRLQRCLVLLSSQAKFTARYRCCRSSVSPGTHLVNLTLSAANLPNSSRSEQKLPDIMAVEMIDASSQWALKHKDGNRFFAVEPQEG